LLVIGCGTDDRYAMALAVTLRSVFETLDASCDATVFIMDGGISAANERRLRRVVERSSRRVDVELVKVDVARYAHLKTTEHVSRAMYFRLLLPEAIPVRFSKVIYLDCDLLVRADLSRLWRADMLGKPLLAAQDFGAPVFSTKTLGFPYQRFGIDPQTPYLNSGVLVMDLARWRAEGYADAIQRFLVEHQADVQFGDQDGINAVMAGNWGELDPLWNVQTYIGLDERYLQMIEDSPHKRRLVRDRRRLMRDAFIWHFVGEWKPWIRGEIPPRQLQWLRTLRQSGWFEGGELESIRTLGGLYSHWLFKTVHWWVFVR
jgi:lipopolysaccharide biosynthesis glycosyltransferase